MARRVVHECDFCDAVLSKGEGKAFGFRLDAAPHAVEHVERFFELQGRKPTVFKHAGMCMYTYEFLCCDEWACEQGASGALEDMKKERAAFMARGLALLIADEPDMTKKCTAAAAVLVSRHPESKEIFSALEAFAVHDGCKTRG